MEVMSALSALSAAIGLAKTAVEARDEAKIAAALTEINTKQLALSMSALHLAESALQLNNSLKQCEMAKADLERECRDLRCKAEDRERYTLHELAPGRIAYRFAPQADSLEPGHYLCQICYDQGVKSVLRPHHDEETGKTRYACKAVTRGLHDLCF